ncbi:MAG TPA: MurR/RpiR family transcriptional regulator [Bacillus bacterium]|uniref:RpiR family transcriptional regulator n=1 Tax=Siminovitchia fordii TaxID=254759 RepID=A0ABQ4K6H9_9BACI|nr:MurR/RpiR family transcriptional regulator [Siminovitchia fordii]GIN20458.1 RpiR family transcriptional regulator [Siminovitchia fordii]HBZ08378.1 MurR/RpiR family transcriptional regulator [Bacillus sp. (in: firmicutes)]
MKLMELVQSQYGNLSKGQQKVAKYLLENPREFALHSAKEIGEKAGLSETTVIRFCYAIGLSGYSELQKNVRDQFISEKSSLANYYSSKLDIVDESRFFEQVMEKDIQFIRETMMRINEADFQKAVDLLESAEKVYICGLRSSFSMANWLAFSLGIVRKNVQLIRRDTDDVLSMISGMNSDSVFVALSFHRYMKETIHIAEMAKGKGACIVGITDSPVAPLRDIADILLPLYSAEMSTLDIAPALISFINAVVAGVTIKDKAKFEKRKEEYERMNSEGLFLS